MAEKLSTDGNKLLSALSNIANNFGCDLVNVNVDRDMFGTVKMSIEVIPRNALSHQGVYGFTVSLDDYSMSGSEVAIHNFVCMEVEKHLVDYFGRKKVGRNFVDQKYIEQNKTTKEQFEELIRRDKIGGMFIDKELEEEMQKRVRPTIVRQNPINTARVKRPRCPIDKVEMLFDAAAQKFYCPEPTCHQVARPKRDSDDKQVILGVGKLQARFIMRPGQKAKLILISDDNISLDITPYIPSSTMTKLGQEMLVEHLEGTDGYVEKMVPIASRRLAGLEFSEMLLMFVP